MRTLKQPKTIDVQNAIPLFPFLELLKGSYKNSIEKLVAEAEPCDINKDYIELYHGTTASNLQNILQNGLLPNKDGENNWEEGQVPLNNVIYLTDKWHYFFAARAFAKASEAKLGTDKWCQFQKEIEAHLHGSTPFVHTTDNFPIVLKVRVNKDKLLADEDFFMSKKINKRVEKSFIEIGVDPAVFKLPTTKEIVQALGAYDINKIQKALLEAYETQSAEVIAKESLSFNGTVAKLGGILPEDIIEIQPLASLDVLRWTLLDETSKYMKDYFTWQSGHGYGRIQKAQMKKIDKSLPLMDKAITERINEISKIEADYATNTIQITY